MNDPGNRPIPIKVAIAIAAAFGALFVVGAVLAVLDSKGGTALLALIFAVALFAVARELIKRRRSAQISSIVVGALLLGLTALMIPDVTNMIIYGVPGAGLVLLVTVPPTARAYFARHRGSGNLHPTTAG